MNLPSIIVELDCSCVPNEGPVKRLEVTVSNSLPKFDEDVELTNRFFFVLLWYL